MQAKLSPRAEKALEILRAGGRFRYALERAWGGGEKFRMRLISAEYSVVPGIGYATKAELEGAGLLQPKRPLDAGGSCWPQEWVLRRDAAAA